MAITKNTYTGNGSTTLYSFTFPYLELTDIKVSVNGVATTAYTFANATTVQFNTAPANGAAIAIYRETDIDAPVAVFFPGSSIRADDLNNNSVQSLYASQEASNKADEVSTLANTANANSAAAVATANIADSNATAAVSSANAALTAVSAAVAYQAVPDLATLLGLTPNNAEFFELQNSTGAESDPNITNIPGGLVGSSGLTFRLRYDDPPGEFVFLGYFANDSENRYAVKATETVAANAASTANAALPKAGGTMTGNIVFNGSQTFPAAGLPTASTSQAGIVQLNNTTNSTSIVQAATANAVKSAFDLANAALPKSGGTMTGVITFDVNQPRLVSGTAVASTSGISIDFTGLPSWTKRITVMFQGVSTNGSSNVILQLGSGSYATSGYLGSGATVVNGSATSAARPTNGIPMDDTGNAGAVRYGSAIITNLNSNSWVSQSVIGRSDSNICGLGGGFITLSGVLDRLRITTINGTDAFDAGSINILYEG